MEWVCEAISKFGSVFKGSSCLNIPLTTIDSFVEKHNLHVGLIKMDIEGYELEAIKGARKTIISQRPVLVISVYHMGKDFLEIPRLIKEWRNDYTLRFLNHNHAHPFSERVLMAW